MKAQAAPLVTGYALACVVLFILLSITGFQVDAIVRAGFIPARAGSELVLPPGTFVPFALTPLTAAFLHGGVLHIAFNLVVLLYIGRQLERSEEHTSELQSLMRISYAVFCLKKQKKEDKKIYI